MTCYVCASENWHKLPGLHTESLLQICKSCGALCHEVNPDRQKKMRDYYRKEYRKMPSANNLITTTNKLQYIRMFLDEWLADKKNLLIGDVGAATGYFLNEMRRRGHRVTGSEYTVTFRRMAEHFYGIPLTEELEPKHKYDLISMYHVLEHIPEPDKALRKYREMLSEKGHMFIATPFWLGPLEEQSGTPIIGGETKTAQDSFNHLFHKDHINLFSTTALQNLFRITGFTVVKDNFLTYGQTYLVKPGNTADIIPEDWQAVLEIVQRQRQAIELYVQGRYNEAVRVWPDFPEAHLQLIFKVYGKDPERQEDMLNSLPDTMKNHIRILSARVGFCKQYQRLDEALQYCQQVQAVRPNVSILWNAAEILSMQGKHKDAMALYAQVANLHPYKWTEAYNELIWNACQMKTWDENASEQAKEALFAQALESGKVKVQNPEPSKPPQMDNEKATATN